MQNSHTMKKIYIVFVLLFSIIESYSQIEPRFTQPRNYRAILKTSFPKIHYTATELKHIIAFESHLISSLQNELNRQIPCLKVTSDKEIINLIRKDREITLNGGESQLTEIGKKLCQADFLISIRISMWDNEKIYVSGRMFQHHEAVNDDNQLAPLNDNLIDDWAYQFAKSISSYFHCPYEGTFLYSTSIKTEETDSKEWTSEGGTYSTSHAKTHKIELSETWDLKVRTTRTPDGNYTGFLLDHYKFDTESKGRCLKFEDGAWLDIFEGFGNSSEHVEKKDELKISGLGANRNNIPNATTYFKVNFDTDSTYKIIVKAISGEGLGTRSYYHQMNYSCPGPPYETINQKTIYKMLKTLNCTFGPFPGKPTDKELTQKITRDFPVENGTSSETIYFKLNR